MAGAAFEGGADDADVRKKLEILRNMGISLKEPLHNAGIYAIRQVDKHFQEEMGPQGPWEELSDATLERRRKGKKNDSSKILQDTGRLKLSIVSGPGHIEELADFSFIFGTNVSYAAVHQYGAVIQKAAGQQTLRFALDKFGLLKKQKNNKNLLKFAKKRDKYALEASVQRKAHTIVIPERPFLYLTTEDVKNIDNIFCEWADEQLRKA